MITLLPILLALHWTGPFPLPRPVHAPVPRVVCFGPRKKRGFV